jgi:hypothetical protein
MVTSHERRGAKTPATNVFHHIDIQQPTSSQIPKTDSVQSLVRSFFSMIGTPLLQIFWLIAAVLPHVAQGNTIRGGQQCEVIHFDYMEFDENGVAREPPNWQSLDLTDYMFGKFNIVALVTDGCKPKCVKISLGDYERKERASPFALFGDVGGTLRQGVTRQSGFQELKACLYLDRACTIGEHGCASQVVDIIPADHPLKAGPFALKPFAVTFNDVEVGKVSEEQTKVAAQSLCQVLIEYRAWDMSIKTDKVVSSVECVGISKHASSGAATIEFNTMASVYKLAGVYTKKNSRLPDGDLVLYYMTDFLTGRFPVSPDNSSSALEYFVNLVGPKSPYSSVTSFTVVT